MDTVFVHGVISIGHFFFSMSCPSTEYIPSYYGEWSPVCTSHVFTQLTHPPRFVKIFRLNDYSESWIGIRQEITGLPLHITVFWAECSCLRCLLSLTKLWRCFQKVNSWTCQKSSLLGYTCNMNFTSVYCIPLSCNISHPISNKQYTISDPILFHLI